MGTRGLWGFVVDGDEKLTYNHFDSYPDGLGAELVRFLHGVDLDELREKARALELVDEDAKPTSEQIDRLREFACTGVSTGRLDEWYVLLRDTQGDPEATLAAGVMIDSRDFASDSLFCEWAYVIDLDAETFEVYEGFQQAPHERGRFAQRPGSDEYQPVALVATFRLDDLPIPEAIASLVEAES